MIKEMTKLANKLEYLTKLAYENEEDFAFEIDEAREKACDLLQGFLTGVYEDDELEEARKMLKDWEGN